jgi:hypothetical protein
MTTANYDYEADATAEDDAEHIFDPADEIEMLPSRNGPKSTLAVRLDGAAIDQLRMIAAKQGVGVTQLVRQWITQRLSSEAPGPVTPAVALDRAIAELVQVAASLRSPSHT